MVLELGPRTVHTSYVTGSSALSSSINGYLHLHARCVLIGVCQGLGIRSKEGAVKNARLGSQVLENDVELNPACLRTLRCLKFDAGGGETPNWN